MFIKYNNESSKVENKDGITIKGYGDFLYPHELFFEKGIRAYVVVNRLLIKWISRYTIFIKEHNKWSAITPSMRIYYDCTIKVEPK